MGRDGFFARIEDAPKVGDDGEGDVEIPRECGGAAR
jgi:hypothetical protein